MPETISNTLQEAYNEQYSDDLKEWRELGAKYKAQNILEVSKSIKYSNVLECGAGEGSILKFLNEEPKIKTLYALEISESGINQIKKRKLDKLVEVKKFDGYNIPYDNQIFDLVYCSHVLEHVEHPRILMRELKRISKYQIFEIPIDYSVNVDEKSTHYLSYGHINIFTPSLFKFLLKSEGFKIISEFHSQNNIEVLRYSYKQTKVKTFKMRFYIRFKPIVDILLRTILGKRRYTEFYTSNYTCLVESAGELNILNK